MFTVMTPNNERNFSKCPPTMAAIKAHPNCLIPKHKKKAEFLFLLLRGYVMSGIQASTCWAICCYHDPVLECR